MKWVWIFALLGIACISFGLSCVSAQSTYTTVDNSELVITKYDGIEAETYLPEINGTELCLYHKAGTNATTLGELKQLIQEAQDQVPDWEIGVYYSANDLVSYNNQIYKVLQSHTSQSDWTPPNVPALFVEYAFQDLGEVPQWVQPTGGHDAYNIGDRVWLQVGEDKLIYESLINANVWSPTVYPAGWEEIGMIKEAEVYGDEEITGLDRSGQSIVVPRDLEEGVSTYCVEVNDYIKIGENTIIAEWINSTLYVYTDDPLEIDPFTIQVFCNGEQVEVEDWVSVDSPIGLGIKFQANVSNFSCNGNLTFRQNQLEGDLTTTSYPFYTTTQRTYIDYSDFENSEGNNIINKTITPVYDLEGNLWEQFVLFFKKIFGYEPSEEEFKELAYYDITYYGNFTDLDPSLELAITSSSTFAFENRTEGSNLGERLETPVLNMFFTDNNESAGYVRDYSIKNNYGTNVGGTYNASCTAGSAVGVDLGGCYEFNTNSGYISTSTTGASIKSGTVCAWAKPSGHGNTGAPDMVFSHYIDSSFANRIYMVKAANTYDFNVRIGTNAYQDTGVDFTQNEWSYVCLNWDGKDYQAFFDGVKVYEDSYAGMNSLDSQFFIGNFKATYTSYYFNGSIDQVQIWDRALSADEVLALYNGTVNQTNYYGKYANEGNFSSFVFYNSSSVYWNTTLSIADSDGSAEVYDLCLADANCVSYWDLDDNVNGILDNKGSNDGTATGTNNATGLSSGAVFMGDTNRHNNRIDLGSSILKNAQINFTISSWVSSGTIGISDGNDGYIYSQFGGDSTNGMLIQRHQTYNGVLIYVDGAVRTYVEDVFDSTSSWHYITAVYNSLDGYKLYVDGAESSDSGAFVDYPTNLESSESVIGNRITGSRGWRGNIDEVLIYNKSLTASEVMDLYKAGLSQHADTNVTLESRVGSGYNLSDESLVSFWGLNDDSGDAIDEMGVQDCAWREGSASTDIAGVVGKGAELGGIIDYLQCYSPSNFDDIEGLGVSAWIYSDDGTGIDGRIISKANDSDSGWGFYFDSSEDSLHYIHGDDDATPSEWKTDDGSLKVDVWNHVYLYFNRSNFPNAPTIYINGVNQTITEVNVDGADTLDSDASFNLLIGARTAFAEYFDGYIDEVRLYNASISEAEIVDLYELGNTHIEWGDWKAQGVQEDGVEININQSGKFMQWKAGLITGDTDVSSYILNYSVEVSENPNPPTNPIIEIIYPVNLTTYDSLQSVLNYSVDDAEFCWFSDDYGSTNSSAVVAGTNFTGLTSVAGVNNWTVYCNKTGAEEGSALVVFTINLPDPVNILSPTTDDQNLVFNLTLSDGTADTDTTLYQWKGVNYTYTSQVDLYASAGTYTIYAFRNDSFGSWTSDSVTFTVRDFNTDTNATTECPNGYYLDGDGSCYPIDLNQTCESGYVQNGYYENGTIICVAQTIDTDTTLKTCRYKKLGYYNTQLPWMREAECV